MNFIDICIGIPLLWAIYRGFKKGFILSIASFIGLWLGIWGSIHFSKHLIPVLEQTFKIASFYSPIAAFFITFLLIILLIYLLALMLQKVVEGIALGVINKLAGAVFNFLKYALIISVFINILVRYNRVTRDEILPSTHNSKLYNVLRKVAPTIVPPFTRFVDID